MKYVPEPAFFLEKAVLSNYVFFTYSRIIHYYDNVCYICIIYTSFGKPLRIYSYICVRANIFLEKAVSSNYTICLHFLGLSIIWIIRGALFGDSDHQSKPMSVPLSIHLWKVGCKVPPGLS